MRYATYVIELQDAPARTEGPFSLLPSTTTGGIVVTMTRHHTSRLDALMRTRAYNVATATNRGRLWMLAVEIDLDTPPDIESVWLCGEQGVLEASFLTSFRLLSPTQEEETAIGSLCERPTDDGWFCLEMSINRIEWESGDWNPETRARLAESLSCFRAGLWRPCIVMLGCVAEAVAGEIQASFERVLLADDKPSYHRRKSACCSTSKRFQVFERYCRPESYALAGCSLLQDAREAFHTVRRLRNASGHPGPREIGQGDAEACFDSLAGLCRAANELTDHFDRLELERMR